MQASQAKDSNVTLPRAVLRRSAAIEARIAARNQPEPEAPPADDPNAPQTPPVAATPAEPQTPPTDPAADPRENDPAYWRQRFKVTEGVLRTERAQRQADAAETNRQLNELRGEIRTLKAKTPTDDAEVDVKQFFTAEQIDQFGEDQCKAIAQAVSKSASAEAQRAIEAAIQPIRDEQVQRETQTAAQKKQAFTDKLGELVPNYAEIDVDPAWIEWLQGEDVSSGLERQAILHSHVVAQNAMQVAKVFRAYEASKTRPTPPVVGKGSGAGPSGDPPPQPAKGLVAPSDAEVKNFFKRAALGKVKDAERTEFEARMKLRTGGA